MLFKSGKNYDPGLGISQRLINRVSNVIVNEYCDYADLALDGRSLSALFAAESFREFQDLRDILTSKQNKEELSHEDRQQVLKQLKHLRSYLKKPSKIRIEK